MSIDALQKDEFFTAFNPPPHVFLSKQHLEMHLQNSNDCIYLADLSCGLGIFLRVSDSIAKSPYSAPFGGIFSKDYRTDWNALNQFISEIGKYLLSTGVKNLRIAFPAPIYSKNITTKVINSLINDDITSVVYIKDILEDPANINILNKNKINSAPFSIKIIQNIIRNNTTFHRS